MGGYGPSPQERGTDLSCRGGYRPLPSTVATPLPSTVERRGLYPSSYGGGRTPWRGVDATVPSREGVRTEGTVALDYL